MYVILPRFKFVKLNSSKYYQFELFKKAVNLSRNNSHLTDSGKLEIIFFLSKQKEK